MDQRNRLSGMQPPRSGADTPCPDHPAAAVRGRGEETVA